MKLDVWASLGALSLLIIGAIGGLTILGAGSVTTYYQLQFTFWGCVLGTLPALVYFIIYQWKLRDRDIIEGACHLLSLMLYSPLLVVFGILIYQIPKMWEGHLNLWVLPLAVGIGNIAFWFSSMRKKAIHRA